MDTAALTTTDYGGVAARLMERIEQLAACSEEEGRLTRRSYTPAMRRAHELVAEWMRAAGMSVHEDSIGNLVGNYPADRSAAKVFMIGSHLDSVRDAGRFDGPLGVLLGIAVVELLRAQNRRLPFAIEVLAFADEEGLRFRKSCLGSNALAGRFDPAWFDLRDPDGVTLAEALREFGGDPDIVSHEMRNPADLLGYAEVHIEQGPVLEQEDLPVGIVTGIAGSMRSNISFRGVAGHAGTVPMPLRHDALCAAAEFILAAEEAALEIPGLVATVGQIGLEPGASNVIPGKALFTLDLRHQENPTRERAFAALQARARQIAASRGVELHWDVIQQGQAQPCDPQLSETLAEAVAAAGHSVRLLPSGAGHDAGVMAKICPAAMLFVRCAGGISHNPAESADASDITVAIEVMSRFFDGIPGTG
jgi:allantoate deiminase